jgi:hypothetical protein
MSLSKPLVRRVSWSLATVLLLSVTVTAADLPRATPESVGVSSARLARLDAMIEAEIAAGRVPGIVVAVARRGRVVHQKASGVTDLATGDPMPVDALFRLYSMTKPIASVALLTLYEQGLFRLTDPLDRYLPQFANVKVFKGLDARGQPILAEPSRRPTASCLSGCFSHQSSPATGTPLRAGSRRHRAETRVLRLEISDPRWVPNPARPSRCGRVLPDPCRASRRSPPWRGVPVAVDRAPETTG